MWTQNIYLYLNTHKYIHIYKNIIVVIYLSMLILY